jgi:hypothetical protein
MDAALRIAARCRAAGVCTTGHSKNGKTDRQKQTAMYRTRPCHDGIPKSVGIPNGGKRLRG